jgi:glycosyltransferase involved in cell wall biosynthesis
MIPPRPSPHEAPIPPRITGHDVVCLSSQDWDDLWTRKQRFMLRLASQGNRILYVETQASLVSLGLLRPDPARAWRWLRGPRAVAPGLHVATLPLVLPGFQMALTVNRANTLALAPLLRAWIRRLGFRAPVLWTYNPHSEGLVGRLREAFWVYECVDEPSAARGLVRATVVRELERRLLDKARVVVVTQENLYHARARPGRHVYLVPNGVDVAHFRAATQPGTTVAPDLARLRRPVVGFVGSLQYWIDFDLLHHVAIARPGWSFVLLGPRGRLADVHKVEGLPNVHLFGRRPYEDLPGYLRGFDACLNPYVLDEVARHASPLKLYEYLAAGRPVVSVDMPEARRFKAAVAIGRTPDEILNCLDEAVAPAAQDPARVATRLAAVAAHSWDQRFRDLEAALAPHFAELASAGAPRGAAAPRGRTGG